MNHFFENPASQILDQGPGWRLGWRSQTLEFQGLVGSDHWAIELTAAEFTDFCHLFRKLHQTLEALTRELMPEEAIAAEAETHLIWMEVAGDPQSYSLSFIVLNDRRVEGYWPAPIAPEFRAACENHALNLWA